jgi:hypothetical protein
MCSHPARCCRLPSAHGQPRRRGWRSAAPHSPPMRAATRQQASCRCHFRRLLRQAAPTTGHQPRLAPGRNQPTCAMQALGLSTCWRRNSRSGCRQQPQQPAAVRLLPAMQVPTQQAKAAPRSAAQYQRLLTAGKATSMVRAWAWRRLLCHPSGCTNLIGWLPGTAIPRTGIAED